MSGTIGNTNAMKLDDIKDQTKEYFDKTSPEDVVKVFEEMGVEFTDIRNTNDACKECIGRTNNFCHCILANQTIV